MAHQTIGIIGLGYVGLPVAVSFAQSGVATVGFDIDERRIGDLKNGRDWTGEIDADRLARCGAVFTSDTNALKDVDVFIVCVPTPIDRDRRPDLRPLRSASQTVGRVMRPGAIVCFESTVYPGVTQDYCGPILAAESGLRQGVDFKLGYSPERINPGDTEHSFETIVKVVAGEDEATADTLAALYGSVVRAGVHRAPSIKVAEAAKVLENTQRDLNVALMNELAIICDLLQVPTRDVLAAAQTKWNFLPFRPGLVGGHCIGVDPYYLTAKAQELGYHPEVILAGRRINDSMGQFVARRLVRLLANAHTPLTRSKVGIVGITFKENVADIRNSRVPDILRELATFGITAQIADPHADPAQVEHEYGLTLAPLEAFSQLDALVLAVPHRSILKDAAALVSSIKQGGVLIDLKSALAPDDVPAHLTYWSL